ncbi:hypothetical protein IHQ68_04910 [Chelatococcus sambhunathii]|uniref:Lipopolysaccharide biosynthesis protein, LPS:glycosyltransferase n=1 Tax=Chelatococcus sambhunathii TaxID=363953 RepID=A0ABU1DCZ1_9HYPH|nr:glycosyltransferase [Chelatococcus sambhunathii]MDR4305964.1 hypothetical protein [Chelatococcus sambhunathii]
MTLRAVLNAGDRPNAASAGDARSTALAFAFDADYLAPFKVMLYSMARCGTLLDCPIYVYSDDPSVFDDAFVRRVADVRRLVDGQDLEELADIAERHIKRPERAKWNRGTCLKWAVFDDAPVDQILFLDVDMLCLRPLEGLLTLHPSAELVFCPQFQRSAMPAEDTPGAKAAARARLTDMLGLRGEVSRRVNSGVMLVRKPLLSRGLRSRLIAFAKGREDINEQSHLTNFFRTNRDRSRFVTAVASSAYNFQENYLDAVDPIDALALLRRIRILHYAGSQKPWRAKITKKDRISFQLWRQFQSSAIDTGFIDVGAAGEPESGPV